MRPEEQGGPAFASPIFARICAYASAIRVIDRRTRGVPSRLDARLYACHPRLVNGRACGTPISRPGPFPGRTDSPAKLASGTSVVRAVLPPGQRLPYSDPAINPATAAAWVDPLDNPTGSITEAAWNPRPRAGFCGFRGFCAFGLGLEPGISDEALRMPKTSGRTPQKPQGPQKPRRQCGGPR
jgi:hypothetical protein